MDTIAEYVYHNRKRLGITQSELALRLGVARTTIVAIEQGKRRLRASELGVLKSIGFPEEIEHSNEEPEIDVRWMRVSDDERLLVRLFRAGRIEKVLRMCLAAKDQRLSKLAQSEKFNEQSL